MSNICDIPSETAAEAEDVQSGDPVDVLPFSELDR